jgi:hypothetical protein
MAVNDQVTAVWRVPTVEGPHGMWRRIAVQAAGRLRWHREQGMPSTPARLQEATGCGCVSAMTREDCFMRVPEGWANSMTNYPIQV